MSMINQNILFIPEDESRKKPLEGYLLKQPYTVKTVLENNINIIQELISDTYSVVVFSLSSLNQCHIELVQHIQNISPKPVILFADQCEDSWIMKAVDVGANSIVVDGIKEHRIKKVIDIAVARFQRCMSLRNELSEAKQRLEDRRDIDRAKGILMKRKQLDENDAYKALRSMAMNKKQRIGEVARTLILASELLD